MFCPNCGAPTEDDAVFCNTCGFRLTEPVNQPVQEAMTQPVSQPAQEAVTEPSLQLAQNEVSAPSTQTENVVRICARCGAKCTGDDMFCGECGAKVFDVQPANEHAPVKPVQYQEQAPVQPVQYQEQAPAQPVQYQEQAPAQPVYYQEPVVSAEPVYNQDPVMQTQNAYNPAPPKKKKKVKTGLIIALSIIVVVAAIVFIFFDNIVNASRKIFMTDEEYYKYVEGQYIEKSIGLGLAIYDDYAKELFKADDKSVTYELRAGISKDFLEDLEKYALPRDAEADWISSVGLKGKSNVKNHKAESNAALYLNDKEILSGEFKIDLEGEKMYATIPQLFDQYIGLDLDEADFPTDEFIELMDFMPVMYDVCPDKAKLDKIASSYMEVILNELDDVSLKDTNIKAKGIKQNVTKAKVVLTRETAQNMILAVMDKFQEDEDLRELVISTFNKLAEADSDFLSLVRIRMDDVDIEDLYDKAVDQVSRETEYLRENVLTKTRKNGEVVEEDAIVMEVYIDGKGEIVGREFRVDSQILSYVAPTDGSDLGFKAYYYNGRREEFSFEGKGKKSGNKVEGDFELVVDGEHITDVEVKKFDLDAFWKGKLKSDVVFANFLPDDITKDTYGKMFRNLSIELITNIDKNNFDIETKFQTNKNDLVEAKIDVDISSGSSVDVPSDSKTVFVEDERDLVDFFEDIDFDRFIEALEDAGVPEEYLDQLERALKLSFDDGEFDIRSMFGRRAKSTDTAATPARDYYETEEAPAEEAYYDEDYAD